MITTKTLVLAPIWGFAIVCCGFLGRSVGPDLEERVFPIISDQSYADATRSADYACWTWSYTKRRSAVLQRKVFVIERPDGIRFPVSEMRPDLGIPSNNSTTAKAGVTRSIPECVAVPPTLRDTPAFVIRGVNIYRSWHGLWDVEQPIVAVAITAPVLPAPEHP